MSEMNVRGKVWFAVICVSVMAWIASLLMQPTGEPMGGGVLNPSFAFFLCGLVFAGGFYYYWKVGKALKGFGVMGVLSLIAFGLLSVNWGALLSSEVVRTSVFVLMGLFVILLTLVQINLVSRWSIPVNLFRWDEAGLLDIGIGVGSGAVLGLMSYVLGYSLIGVPIGLVPSSFAGANVGSGVLVGLVAFIENAIIIGVPIGLVYGFSGYLSEERAGVSRSRAEKVAFLVSLVAAVSLVVLVAYVFHIGAYGGREFSLVGVSLLFGFWGVLSVVRKSTLAADLSHFTYNLLVIVLGVTRVGMTLL